MVDKIIAKAQTYGYSPEELKKFTKYATMMLFGFSIMYAFFYNGRQNMALAIPLMMDEFGVSKAELGVITSSLFWCYGFGHLFSGRLGEVFGNKKFIFCGVIASAILNFTISFQSSLVVIAILWGLNGLAQSMAWSPGIALSSKWWPKNKRGYSSGVLTGFSGVAQVVTYFCIIAAYALSEDWGWRAAFRWPLVPMVLILVVFVLLVKDSPKDVGLEDFKEEDLEAQKLEEQRMKDLNEKGNFYPYICLLKEPKMRVFLFIIAIGGIGRYGLLTWIPSYFQETLGFEIKQGIFAAVTLPVGMAIAFFLMPYLSDKIFKGKREPLLVICGVIAAACLFIMPSIQSQLGASAMLLVVGIFSSLNGIVWAFAGDIGTRAFAGTATGLLDWAAYMGAAVQSMLFGYVAQISWSYVFFTIGALYIVMVMLALAARKMKVRGYAQ